MKQKLKLQFALLLILMLVQFAEATLIFLSSAPVSTKWINGAVAAVLLILASGLLRSRNAILREAARTEALTQATNDGLIFLEKGRLAFANPAAKTLLASGNDSTAAADLPPALKDALEFASVTREPVPYEATIDGSLCHYVIFRARNLERTDGKKAQQVYVLRNMTFIHELEEAKTQFIRTLSHEIKTPLTSLSMALAMLQRAGHDDELVRISNADVTRLRRLLDELLNVSKLKLIHRTDAAFHQETDLSALVDHAVKEVRLVAQRKGLAISALVARKPDIVATVDPTRLSWAISALFTEAIQNSHSGSEIRIQFGLLGTNQALLTIHYAGPVTDPTAGSHPAVRDIVESHGGRFTCLQESGGQQCVKLTITARKGTSHANETHLARG